METGFSNQTFGPIAVAVDRHDRIQAFTPEGKFLFGMGGSGTELGQFEQPHGLAFDNQGHIYVADSGNQRIQKFEIPSP